MHPPLGAVGAGVLEAFLSDGNEGLVLADMLLGGRDQAQRVVAVEVVLSESRGGSPVAGFVEVDKAFGGQAGMVLRGAEEDLRVRVVVAHPRP